MRKPFDQLFEGLKKSLDDVHSEQASVGEFARAINLIRTKIYELRALSKKSGTGKEGEVDFFRHVWPEFYGKLFLYIKIYQFETTIATLPVERRPSLIRREELGIRRFFRMNEEFTLYYRSGSPAIDYLFTRQYSQGMAFDELSLVIDPEGATLASHRAAWCLAYGEYKLHLEREMEKLLRPKTGTRRRYEWKEGKTAAVELIKSQAEAQSIYIDGKPATAVQLREDHEEKYDQDLKDFDLLLYAADTRKKDETPYLTKLVLAFKGRKARLRK